MHDHETVGAPSVEELGEAGLIRCSRCHEPTDETEIEDGLCQYCLEAPAVCRKCGEPTTLRMLTVDGYCEECEPGEWSLSTAEELRS